MSSSSALFLTGFCFFYWAAWAVCRFCRLIPCWSYYLQIFFSSFCGLFHFVYGFLHCAKAFEFTYLFPLQWQPTPVLLPGKSREQSLVGCSPWGHEQSDTTEQNTFTFHFPALEKEMATHSSVLAWRIPGTGEPGGLPSMGSHRVGHDWSVLAAVSVAGDSLKKILL